MADPKKTPVIEIKTIEAVKNIQDLKNNIKELKKQLDTLEIGTDKYKDKLKELSTNEAALRNAMNGTSASMQQVTNAAKGLDDSYNSLVQQLKLATQAWRSIPQTINGEVNPAFDEAANKVLELREKLKGLDAQTGSYVRNVGNYEGALRNFASSMGYVKQAGQGINQGIASMVSVLGTLGVVVDDDNRAMKSWNATLAIMNGAEGIGKAVKGLLDFIKSKTADRIETDKDTVSTAQNTVIQRENTIAKEVADKATKKLTLSTTALYAVLTGGLMLAIGALVANWDKVSETMSGVGEKLRDVLVDIGLLNEDFSVGAVSVSEYKREFKEFDDEVERHLKMMAASGLSTTEQIQYKIGKANEKLDLTQQRLHNVGQELLKFHIPAWMKADTALAAFARRLLWINSAYKGTIKAYEYLEDLQEQSKNEVEQANFELELEHIRQVTEARKKAAEDAARKAKEEAEKLVKAVDKALEKAKSNAYELLEPEEKINAKYKEQIDLLENGLKALDEQAKKGGNLEEIAKKRKTIEDGITATYKLQAKELSDLKAKEYEKLFDIKKNTFEYENKMQQGKYSRISSIMKNSLGYTDAQINLLLQKNASYLNEVQQQIKINKKLSDSIANTTKNYEGLREGLVSVFGEAGVMKDLDDQLKQAFEMSVSDPEGFAKAFSEPLATAIKRAFELTQENEGLKQEMIEMVTSVNDEIFKRAIENNDPEAALKQAKGFINGISAVYKAFFGEDPSGELSTAFSEYQGKMFEKAFDTLINDAYSISNIKEVGQSLVEAMFPESTDNYIRKRAEAWMQIINAVSQSYGKSTANLLSSTGDMWDNYLKLRYKKQVESGRKTEEEAKAQAEAEFKVVKGLQIAAAVINTASAVVQALADPTVPSYYLKAINAAAALAAGTAQVLQIRATEFGAPGTNGGANEVQAPSLVQQAPQVNYTVGVNEADYAAAQAQNPIHCYITDKELNDGLEQYNARENETTF